MLFLAGMSGPADPAKSDRLDASAGGAECATAAGGGVGWVDLSGDGAVRIRPEPDAAEVTKLGGEVQLDRGAGWVSGSLASIWYVGRIGDETGPIFDAREADAGAEPFSFRVDAVGACGCWGRLLCLTKSDLFDLTPHPAFLFSRAPVAHEPDQDLSLCLTPEQAG
eukprot:SAG11_NODE_11_length_27870_cov_16.327428_4_plen_166_part_00